MNEAAACRPAPAVPNLFHIYVRSSPPYIATASICSRLETTSRVHGHQQHLILVPALKRGQHSERRQDAYLQVISICRCPCGVRLYPSCQVLSYWAGGKKSYCTELAAIRPCTYATNSASCRHHSEQDDGGYWKCRKPNKSRRWNRNLQQKCHNVFHVVIYFYHLS